MRGSRGVGQEWERLAEKTLVASGYRILDRNVRTRAGELDFVARERDTLCFIEVKGRRSMAFGLPEEAVTLEKQRRIFRAAEAYLRRRRIRKARCRFDVVSVSQLEGRTQVQILRDAFVGPPRRRLRR